MISSADLELAHLLNREKSLVAVARVSNISASAVSQRLTALESKLGVRIAERIGRSGIVMTEEGEYLAQQGEKLLGELREIDERLAEKKGVLAGHLRIVAPFGFGRVHIAPLCQKFQTKHPDISITLTLTESPGRIPEHAWDIIVRVAPLRDTSLKMKKLASNRRLVCASPGYVAAHGAPQAPEDLVNHQCIVVNEDDEDATLWHFRAKNGQRREVRVEPALSTNDGEAALDWAIKGGGIIIRSEWSAAGHFKAAELVEVMPNWSAPDAPIIALTSGPKGRTGRAQKMLEFLEQEVRKRRV